MLTPPRRSFQFHPQQDRCSQIFHEDAMSLRKLRWNKIESMRSSSEFTAASDPPSGAAATRLGARVDRQRGRVRFLLPLALVILPTILYLPSISNDFIFDDHVLILQQRRPERLADLLQVFAERHWPDLPYYRPVARFTMVTQKLLHGDQPGPYHAFNAIVMGLVSAAAYLLFRFPAFGMRVAVAWLGALLVAVHPVASSCVYPICSGRETSLPALFMLLATGAWLRTGWHWRVVSLLGLAAALLSKEQAIVTPAIFVVADVLRLSEQPFQVHRGHWLRRYLPVVGFVMIYLSMRMLLFGGREEHRLAVLDQPILPLLTVMYAAQTTFLPFLALHYEPTPQGWFSCWRQVISWSLLLVIGVATVRARARVRATALFWLAWIVLVNLPTANLLVQAACFDERYGLLSLVGVVGLVGELLSLAWHRLAARYLTIAVAVAWVFALASVSFSRAACFRDDFAFFRQWKATDPDFDFAATHAKIAMLDLRRGQYVEADAHARAALEASPDAILPRIVLGEALLGQGRLDDAQRQYDSILSQDGKYPDALAGTAEILATRGQWAAAARLYRAALRKQPISADAARRYAWLLATCPDVGIRNGKEAVRWATVVFNAGRQEDARVLETLAAAYAEVGDFSQAIHWQSQAIGLLTGDEAAARQRLAGYRAATPCRASLSAAKRATAE